MMIEFTRGMKKADKILMDWKQKEGDPQEAYHELYGHIMKFNKQIAERYDGPSNSILIYIVIQQFNEGLIAENEFEAFSEETQMRIRLIRSM